MGNGKTQHENREAEVVSTEACYRSKPHAEVNMFIFRHLKYGSDLTETLYYVYGLHDSNLDDMI